MSNGYWLMRSGKYEERKARVDAAEVLALKRAVFNDYYNKFVGDHAEVEGRVDATLAALTSHTHGKRVPYIGWYWRSTGWYDGDITIADSGEFVGVCENNKWDYPQRRLTPAEFAQVVEIVDDAMANEKEEEEIMAKLWPLFQTFKVEPRSEDEL